MRDIFTTLRFQDCLWFHYENLSMQHTEIFFSCKKMKISSEKNDICLIFAQNIDYRGGSNEYPQSIFWSKNKKK